MELAVPLVEVAMLGVASEGSKKESEEWGDRQIRENRKEGDGVVRGGDFHLSTAISCTAVLESLRE